MANSCDKSSGGYAHACSEKAKLSVGRSIGDDQSIAPESSSLLISGAAAAGD
jgi:hypothetical protein